jgi:acyl carrier protein
MNTTEAEDLVRRCLGQIAPEVPFADVAADVDYREALALDSVDFLQLVELLSERTGVRIDESDYPKLATIASTVDFLAGLPVPRA